MSDLSRRGFLQSAIAAVGTVIMGPTLAEAAKSIIPLPPVATTDLAPRVLTKDTIIEFIIDCGQVLDEQNLPESGRFMFLPPWALALVKYSDVCRHAFLPDDVPPRFTVRVGECVGMIDRFQVYTSQNLEQLCEPRATFALFGNRAFKTLTIQEYVSGKPFDYAPPEVVEAQVWRALIAHE